MQDKRTASTSAHLAPANVLLAFSATGGQHRVLEALAIEAATRLGRPADAILDALRAREALGTTALGRGVALPHARLPGDHPPLLLLVRLARAVNWDARDGEDVDLVLLVLWPEASPDGFLPTLAEVCRALREPRTLRQLRAAATPAEVVALLPFASGSSAAGAAPP